MKLQAVAPGGPPEGKCKEEQEMVWNTTVDDPFGSQEAVAASLVERLVLG